MIAWGSEKSFKPKGPIASPAAKYPKTEPKPKRLKIGTAIIAAPKRSLH